MSWQRLVTLAIVIALLVGYPTVAVADPLGGGGIAGAAQPVAVPAQPVGDAPAAPTPTAKPSKSAKAPKTPTPAATKTPISASTPDDPLLRSLLWAAGGLMGVLLLLMVIGGVRRRRRR